MTDDEWAERVRANRAEKDEFFAEHRQSPLPPDQREEFDGLDYFPPDPTYSVTATVTVHDDPDEVELTVRNGTAVRYDRTVTLSFELPRDDGGDPASETLAGYSPTDEPTLFVPFRDKTTGQETYDGGRYMDLHPDGELSDGDEVTLDFNLAYTPFCAFADAFACPLPPSENWLDSAVRAGERAP